jgi:hypothetical protein
MTASTAGQAAPTSATIGSTPGTRPAVDLRHLITSPLIQQGARPLCLPLSLSHAHEAAVTGSVDAVMAPEAIWWHCSKLGQVSADGMQMEHGGKALARTGQPPLAAWPWNPLLGAGTEDPPPAAGRPPWRTATMTPLQLAHDGIEDDLEDALAAGQPVVLVVEVTDEFENPDADGVIATPDIRSPAGDYHAVLVVGASSHINKQPSPHNVPQAAPAVAQRHLLIRNSWGEFWGAGGYGWLPVDYLIAFAGQAALVGV